VCTARGVSISAEERPSGEGQKTYKGGSSSGRGSSLAFCREYCCGVQGGSKGVITDYLCSRCWYGIVAESTRAGRSEESPEDPGPNAVCGFATPQRQVSSGPNAKALPEFISTTKFALVQSQSF
jgi:hypothetical protein